MAGKTWYEQNKWRYRIYAQRYYEKNKETIALRMKKYYQKNKNKIYEQIKRYREKNKDIYLSYHRSYNKRLRIEVLKHYSKPEITCACCGEKEIEFLTIDHIHGGGSSQRKFIRGNYIYYWLRKNNFPRGYQVLCMNCNFAKGRLGKCPHLQ